MGTMNRPANLPMMSQRKRGFRLGVYVFKDVEIVDFTAPHGVFSVARRFDPELEVFLIADAQRPVQAQAGFTVLPNYSFADRPAMDAFLIPGGAGTRQETWNTRLHDYIDALPATCLLTSVCTGSLILGAAGLLKGYKATSYWDTRDVLKELGAIPTRGRIVVDRNRITGGGVTAGIDFGLKLVALLKSRVYAEAVQLYLEYDPQPPFNAGSPEKAQPLARQFLKDMFAGMRANALATAKRAMQRLLSGPT